MLRPDVTTLLCLASLLTRRLAAGAATWPSSIDELEDIMVLQTGFRARGFTSGITPCGFSSKGPGRSAAAEYIRTSFHDAATANVYTGAGGADASIMFELASSDNAGIGFTDTLTGQAPFLSSRASAADLIALGMYAGVRVCGGPVIPIRAGRVDATVANNPGVPQPQNSQYTFVNQFLRFGFDQTQMVQLVACGHTIGGVHSSAFPQIAPPASSPNGVRNFDATSTSFDPRIAVDYVAGANTDPLVSGPSVAAGRNSDYKVFTVDQNATIKGMQDPAFFRSTCQTLLGQLTEKVPGGVTLTADPIAIYDVKPSGVQLTLLDANTIQFAGYIRVRTTTRAASSVSITYLDRTGGNAKTTNCASAGTAAGLDDTFSFFSFNASLPATSSISSFTVSVNGAETFDNNGAGFPVQDSITYQQPQSCLAGNNITVVAAVRDAAATPNLVLTLKTSRGASIPTPKLSNVTVAMTPFGDAVGPYSIYAASYTLADGQGANTKFDVTTGGAADSFKDSSALAGTCGTLSGGSATSSSAAPSSTSSAPPSSSSAPSSTSSAPSSTSSAPASTSSAPSSTSSVASSTSSVPSSTSSDPSSTSSTSAAAPSGWTYQGCVTEANGARALTGASTTSGTMTNAKCAAFCAKFAYFGTEYASECYCGNSRDSTSASAPAADCNMACSGAAGETCGAGNRLSLYSNDKFVDAPPALAGYTYQGCYTENNPRVLSAASTSNGTSMTYESCAAFCDGYALVGLEYGAECYCGDAFAQPTTKGADSDCNMACAGAPDDETCGGPNRLTVFKANAPSSPQLHGTDLPGWKYVGCRTDSVGSRGLSASQLFASDMTLEKCSAWCMGYIYFGTEYATECYCGDAFTGGSTTTQDGDCSMKCGGNATEYCGAGNRLSVYAKQT